MSADAPVTEDVAAGPSVWICDFTDAEDRLAFARLMAEFAAELQLGAGEGGEEGKPTPRRRGKSGSQ